MGLKRKSIKTRFDTGESKNTKLGIFALSGLALSLCVKIDKLFCLVYFKI